MTAALRLQDNPLCLHVYLADVCKHVVVPLGHRDAKMLLLALCAIPEITAITSAGELMAATQDGALKLKAFEQPAPDSPEAAGQIN